MITKTQILDVIKYVSSVVLLSIIDTLCVEYRLCFMYNSALSTESSITGDEELETQSILVNNEFLVMFEDVLVGIQFHLNKPK